MRYFYYNLPPLTADVVWASPFPPKSDAVTWKIGFRFLYIRDFDHLGTDEIFLQHPFSPNSRCDMGESISTKKWCSNMKSWIQIALCTGSWPFKNGQDIFDYNLPPLTANPIWASPFPPKSDAVTWKLGFRFLNTYTRFGPFRNSRDIFDNNVPPLTADAIWASPFLPKSDAVTWKLGLKFLYIRDFWLFRNRWDIFPTTFLP